MSKHIRLIAATALCLSMTLAAACALAAPKLKLTLPSKEIRGGADYNITLRSPSIRRSIPRTTCSS